MDGNELVRQMHEAWVAEGRGGYEVDYPHERMAAAAKVCIDEALAYVSLDELGGEMLSKGGINNLFDDRKARLLAPKTAEERVEVIASTNGGWAVHVDGKQVFWQSMKEHAETFRRGRIAELKEQHS
jgi:hypothetical protein